MKFIGKTMPTVAAVAVSSVLAAGGGAFAATTLVQSKDIAPNAVTNSKIAPGAVTQDKLSQYTRAELAQTKANQQAIGAIANGGAALEKQVQGLAASQFSGKYSDLTGAPDLSTYAQKSDLPDVSGLESKSDEASDIKALQDEVKALQAQVNGSWNQDAGTLTLNNDGSLTLTETADDTSGAGASNDALRNYTAGQAITVSGTLADGAEASQGAPRAYIIINGVVYTSVDNVNPNYGTNADGTSFTEQLVPVSYTGDQAPSGVITQVGVAYDNTSAPGSVTFTSLKIGNTTIPLS